MNIDPSTRPRESIANAEALILDRNRSNEWRSLVIAELAQLQKYADEGRARLRSTNGVEGQQHIQDLIDELERNRIALTTLLESKAKPSPWPIVLVASIVGVLIAVVALYLLISKLPTVPSLTQNQSEILLPKPIAHAPSIPSCGVAQDDIDARIWIEGIQAQSVCDALVVLIRESGKQPSTWDGRIHGSSDSFYPVCSDALSAFSYEVIDTGMHIFGESWCQWIVKKYGASKKPTSPDLFGIIRTARQAEEEDSKSKNAAERATKDTNKAIYAAACKEHKGYISEGEVCVADYPGWSHQRVAINEDGSWNSDQADTERLNCETRKKDSDLAAQNGRAWKDVPEYHPDTGVCFRGNQ